MAVLPTSGSGGVAVLPTSGSGEVAVLPTSGSGEVTVLPASGSGEVAVLPASSSGEVAVLPASGSGEVAVLPTSGSGEVAVLPTSGSGELGIFIGIVDGTAVTKELLLNNSSLVIFGTVELGFVTIETILVSSVASARELDAGTMDTVKPDLICTLDSDTTDTRDLILGTLSSWGSGK